MAELRWTEQALDDIDAISAFIAKDSLTYAKVFVGKVFSIANQLITFPQSGRVVPELEDPRIRELIFGNYRIIYRLQKTEMEILTVYHGARLLNPDWLSGIH